MANPRWGWINRAHWGGLIITSGKHHFRWNCLSAWRWHMFNQRGYRTSSLPKHRPAFPLLKYWNHGHKHLDSGPQAFFCVLYSSICRMSAYYRNRDAKKQTNSSRTLPILSWKMPDKSSGWSRKNQWLNAKSFTKKTSTPDSINSFKIKYFAGSKCYLK